MHLSPKQIFCVIMSLLAGASVLIGSMLHAKAQQRIVVLGSSVGEIAHALGAGDQLVARDLSCVYPPEIAALPAVGYHRTISAEGVLAQKPTILICTAAAGPANALEQIEAAGVKVVEIPDAKSVEELLTNVNKIADAIGATSAGENLVEELNNEIQAALEAVATYKTKPRVLFLMSGTDSGRYFVGGTGSAAHSMIKLTGGTNAAAKLDGFKMLGVESIIALKPDVVLVPSGGDHGVRNLHAFADGPAIRSTPAGQNRRVFAIDLVKTLGMGPRLPEAIRELAGKIHAQRNRDLASSN